MQRARIGPGDTTLLVKHGHFELLPGPPRGGVFVFLIPQLSKQRMRVIQYPRQINEVVPSAPGVTFKTIPARVQQLFAGGFAIQVDFATFYPSFQLAPAVRDFFCALLPVASEDGTVSWRPHRLCVGATGQSHMVFAACATTALLLGFTRRSVAVDSQIDNTLFVGDRDAVMADLREFSGRCRSAGVTINEDTSDPSALVSSVIDWCGLHLDFSNKTVALTEKVVGKLRGSWADRSIWSWRGFAAHCGLLFYAAQVIDVPVASFFGLLRFVSHAGFVMQDADDKLWDSPAVVWPSASAALESWTAIALRNEPRVVRKAAAPDFLVLVDSSAWGWGYVAWDSLSGAVYAHGEAWSADFALEHGTNKLRRSTFTEPHGVLQMKRHLLPNVKEVRSFRVGSDNVATVATLRRGFASRSFDLNRVAELDRGSFDRQHQWEYLHVPGALNDYADAFSRGKHEDLTSEVSRGRVIESLRRLLGEGPAESVGGGSAV